MKPRRRDYFITYTILGFAMAAYSLWGFFGTFLYAAAAKWADSQEASGFHWLSRLFFSDWTMVPVQYVFVLGFPYLLVLLIVCRLPKSKRRPKRLMPAEAVAGFVIALGLGYPLNFIGNMVNLLFSMLKGGDPAAMNPVIEVMNQGLTPGMVIYTCLLGPVMEEVMFRGILLSRARRLGDGTAVVFCAVMFGLMHGNLTQFLYATVIGLVLGYLTVQSGRIRYSVLVHVLINTYSVLTVLGQELISATGLFFAEAGYSIALVGSVLLCVFGGVAFAILYAPDWVRSVRKREFGRGPGKKYAWLNPGFLLYAAICAAEIVSYLF